MQRQTHGLVPRNPLQSGPNDVLMHRLMVRLDVLICFRPHAQPSACCWPSARRGAVSRGNDPRSLGREGGRAELGFPRDEGGLFGGIAVCMSSLPRVTLICYELIPSITYVPDPFILCNVDIPTPDKVPRPKTPHVRWHQELNSCTEPARPSKRPDMDVRTDSTPGKPS